MAMTGKERKTCLRVMAVAVLIGLVFWIAESILGYFLYAERMRQMLVQAPLTFVDSLLFNIPAHDLLIRIAFMGACILSGVLIARYLLDLQASEERFKVLVETAPEGIFVQTGGYFAYLNPAAVQLFGGGSADQILGQRIFERIDPQSHDAVKEGMQQLKADGKAAPPLELHYLRLDENPFIVEAIAVPVRWEGKNGDMVFFRDITERKQLAERMMLSQKLVDLGTLAAGVAHEINSPLQVITGSSESILRQLARGKMTREDLEKRAERINRNAWRVAEITRSLLTYARSSHDELAPAQLNKLVADALLLVEHQMRAWSNIDIQTRLAEDLPEFICDPNKIIQVMINLLINARDAMPDGGLIRVYTGFKPSREQLILEISDSGEGIPAETLGRIFDPFFTTKPVGKGTGLGLSIVHGIVQSHGGGIGVESMPGEGTTFTLHFPLKPPPPVPGPVNIRDRFNAGDSDSPTSF